MEGDDKADDQSLPPEMPDTLNWTDDMMHAEIRQKLGYDPANLYKDEEGGDTGMAKQLGL